MTDRGLEGESLYKTPPVVDMPFLLYQIDKAGKPKGG
jgi:hypothetical protein